MRTVARYTNTALAHVGRAKLEASGIDAIVAEDATASVAWHLVSALGGVRLVNVAAASAGLRARRGRLGIAEPPADAYASTLGNINRHGKLDLVTSFERRYHALRQHPGRQHPPVWSSGPGTAASNTARPSATSTSTATSTG